MVENKRIYYVFFKFKKILIKLTLFNFNQQIIIELLNEYWLPTNKEKKSETKSVKEMLFYTEKKSFTSCCTKEIQKLIMYRKLIALYEL